MNSILFAQPDDEEEVTGEETAQEESEEKDSE